MAGMLQDMKDFGTALSKSAAFRTFAGAATPAIALTKIHRYSIAMKDAPGAMVALRRFPCETVTLDQEFLVAPELVVCFVDIINRADSDQTVFDSLTGTVDSIMAQLFTNSDWPIRSWDLSDPVIERDKATAATDSASIWIVVQGHLREAD